MWAVLALFLGVLLLLDGLCVLARAGLLNANLARLLPERERMEQRVAQAVGLIHAPQHLRAGLGLLQNTLRFLAAGCVMMALLWVKWFDPAQWLFLLTLLGFLLLAAFVWFMFEWLLQNLALGNPEWYALRLTPFARTVLTIFAPLLWLPLAFSKRVDTDEESVGNVTEADLKNLVDVSQAEGVLEQGERKMIYSIFELGDTLAREIMVPRIDMVAVEVSTDLAVAAETISRAGFSRMPVYQDSVDTILGLLYARDLLQVWRDGQQVQSLQQLLRPAHFIPEAKKVDELLAEMQSMRIHMAIVVDEYGGVAGLVTLEDIMEEIVGEIQDEYDQAEELPYQQVGEGEYIFQGRVDLGDFNEVMAANLPQTDADTIGGFLYSRMGRVPTNGEALEADGLILIAELVIARRVRKVRARWAPVLSAPQEVDDHVET
jgi:CBS domain containing-hemolysin-like protein